MTPQQIALVQQSFAQVLPIREQAAALFYEHLFAIDPSTRPLFRGDMKAQGAKLMAAIGTVVKSLDRLDTMLDDLRALARRHDRYGVQDAHYASVGEALCGPSSRGWAPASHRICGPPGPPPTGGWPRP
jgi:nitric oxide dioxygenase